MRILLRRAAKFASNDAPVVVLGETGSGKEILARTLHLNSTRSGGAFVALNVAALPGELLESELFGHGKGAFTGALGQRLGLFEAAHEGTLFLDEIGEMPLPLQAKLLRALQDGEIRRVGENRAFAVDARIICATHRDLAQRVRDGAFREDLFFRLKVLTLRVPPLRERREDILPLATQFLSEESRLFTGFSAEAKELLLQYFWPGNVRELENAVRHGAALAEGPEIDAADLPEELVGSTSSFSDSGARRESRNDFESSSRAEPLDVHPLRPLADVEREHILRMLAACGGCQSEAARALGIARNTLWRKLQSYE